MKRLLRFGYKHIQQTNEILFYVNGKKFQITHPDPRSSLSDFLRKEAYTGVKISCDEGVCGSCTVVLQEKKKDGEVCYKSINSCKYPLFAADGMHIITPEIAESNDSLFLQIQDNMASKNGSQCGFCSPGIMMNIYNEILENPTISELEMEEALNNNQCRCTGYRPIMHAIKDVLENPNIANQVDYPRELEGYECYGKAIELGDGVSIYKPVVMEDFVEYFQEMEDREKCFIVSGGIDFKRLNEEGGKVLLDPRGIEELQELKMGDMLQVGSSVKLQQLLNFCKERIGENEVFEALATALKRLGTKQIRNVGTVAGNLFNRAFVPEILLIFSVLNAEINYIAKDFSEKTMNCRGLLSKEELIHDIFLVKNIEVPLTEEKSELFKYYKVSNRYFADIPFINGGLKLSFEDESGGKIEDCAIIFGGMLQDQSLLRCKNTKSFLIGKELNEKTFMKALEILKEEVADYSDQFSEEGRTDYRQTLILSMFLKFFKEYQRKFCPENLDDRELSMFNSLEKTEALKTYIDFEEVMQGPLHGKSMDSFKSKLLSGGNAQFTDDIPRREGELCAYIVTSPIPHGRIIKLDGSKALECEGVEGFITYKNIEKRGGKNLFGCTGVLDEEMLASETVQAVGQPVAILVAESFELAKKAAEKVVLELEPLPSLLTIDDAIEAESFFAFYPQMKTGDINKGFKECDHIIEREFEISGQDHMYGETQINISVPEDNDELNIVAATQDCGGLQKHCSMVLNIPQHKIVVRTKRMGGGFGGKQSRGGYFAILNSLAAVEMGKPTRLKLDRDQDMKISGGRHPFKSKYKVGFNKDGTITTLKLDLFSNGGYCTELTWAVMDKAILCSDQAYKIENNLITSLCCKTNYVSPTAFRGFGAPQSQLIMEEVVEQVADFLNTDAFELRKLNMYEEGDETPIGFVLNDCHLPELWSQIHEMADYDKRVKEVEEFNAKNKFRKRGLHLMPAKVGMGYCDAPFLNAGAALVHIYSDASVLVSIGGTEMGQGLFHKVAQTVASHLGIPLEYVNVIETATDKTAMQPPTAASIGSDVFGGASANASLMLNDRLKDLKEELGYPDKCDWEELINEAQFRKINLSAQAYYELFHIIPPEWEHEGPIENWEEIDRKTGDPFPYLIYGAVATEVEVDCLTGEMKVIRADMIEDVGNSINPLIDIGQVEGAFVQGMGYTTMEEVFVGNKNIPWVEEGHVWADNMLKYNVPLAHDAPQEFNVALMKNVPTKWHESFMSSKTSGEPPFFMGGSVFFAIRQAVLDFRKRELGIDDNVDSFIFNVPATAEKIRMACSDDLMKMIVDTDSYKADSFV